MRQRRRNSIYISDDYYDLHTHTLLFDRLTDEEKKSVTDKLESHGYVYEILGNMDIDAIRKDVYDEIKETLNKTFLKFYYDLTD